MRLIRIFSFIFIASSLVFVAVQPVSAQRTCPAGYVYSPSCGKCVNTSHVAGVTFCSDGIHRYDSCDNCMCPGSCGTNSGLSFDSSCNCVTPYALINPSTTTFPTGQSGYIAVTGSGDPAAPVGAIYSKTATGVTPKLRLKVAATGAASDWQDVGGATYTAGTNININGSNVVGTIASPTFTGLTVNDAGIVVKSATSSTSFPTGAYPGSLIVESNIYTNAISSKLPASSVDNIWIGDNNDTLQVPGYLTVQGGPDSPSQITMRAGTVTASQATVGTLALTASSGAPISINRSGNTVQIGGGLDVFNSLTVRQSGQFGSNIYTLPTTTDAVLAVNAARSGLTSSQYLLKLATHQSLAGTDVEQGLMVDRNGNLTLSGDIRASGDISANTMNTNDLSVTSTFGAGSVATGNLSVTGTTTLSDTTDVGNNTGGVLRIGPTGGTQLRLDQNEIATDAGQDVMGTGSNGLYLQWANHYRVHIGGPLNAYAGGSDNEVISAAGALHMNKLSTDDFNTTDKGLLSLYIPTGNSRTCTNICSAHGLACNAPPIYLKYAIETSCSDTGGSYTSPRLCFCE